MNDGEQKSRRPNQTEQLPYLIFSAKWERFKYKGKFSLVFTPLYQISKGAFIIYD